MIFVGRFLSAVPINEQTDGGVRTAIFLRVRRWQRWRRAACGLPWTLLVWCLCWLPHVIADDDYESTKSSLNGPLVGR